MSVEHDFIALYRQLGVAPDDGLAAFRQAYRRHVAAWHPDRAAMVDVGRLQQLTAQYSAAMDFHRLHGRLPGATARNARGPHAAVVAPRSATARRPGWLVPSLLVLAGAWTLWQLLPSSSTTPRVDAESAADSGVPMSIPEPVSTSVASLALGMSKEQVRALEGEPPLVRGDRWEYGASWIRFEGERVVEWHSSPLSALRGASPSQPH